MWELWADPRKLERWWGPPTYPATVKEHDLTPGGTVSYFMTGPEGDTHHGYWAITSANAPKSLEFIDGFADDDGTPNAELPTTSMAVELSETRRRDARRDAVDLRLPRADGPARRHGHGRGHPGGHGQMDALLAA